jgi:hypothetical protein
VLRSGSSAVAELLGRMDLADLETLSAEVASVVVEIRALAAASDILYNFAAEGELAVQSPSVEY